MPSSTSLIPTVWPARTVEMLIFLRCMQMLPQAVHAGRPGRFPLQGEVHALVAAVLLGMARLDALDLDAEPQPPYGQLRQVEQGVGTGEGHAVVGADGDRQATLCEQPLEGGEGQLLAG